ncbi:TPA: hypothetical protein HA278_06855 [Candidatus Woesearchaeota archaeon]|nr:hypothetical protein [Candidatus Woesearchaeota archaeon]
MKSDKLTIFGDKNWGSYTDKANILQRVLPTYKPKKIKFRVTKSENGINVTYQDITEEMEPEKEYFINLGNRIKSSEYILTNDQYTEQPIRNFWYDDKGEMWESNYQKIVDEWGSELIETFNLMDKRYFFSTELGKELTDITDPYGHLTWTISDCTEENEAFAWQTNLIAFDYIISECNQMVFLDSTFDNERASYIDKFESHIVSVDDAIEVAESMLSGAEDVLIECWNNDEGLDSGCMLSSEGGKKYIESITKQINRIQGDEIPESI